MQNRILLNNRLDQRRAEIVSLKEEIASLEARQRQLSNNTESFRESIESLEKLDRLLAKATENDAIDLRLRLRQVLRGLIDRIEIYPEGIVRHTPEFGERALRDLSMVYPEGSTDYDWIREHLRERTSNPRADRQFTIWFVGGSARTINPARVHPFTRSWTRITAS